MQLNITIDVNGVTRKYVGEFDDLNNTDWSDIMYNFFSDIHEYDKEGILPAQ